MVRRTALIGTVIGLALCALISHRAETAVLQDVLVKASGPAVYYYASDGKRYVFPTEGVYYSWFTDFSSVQSISNEALASITLGGNVTYRPGIRMVKIQTDPKVYAVDRGGVLRWVTSENVARMLFGSDWNKNIHDISDAFFVNYRSGEPIYLDSDYRPTEIAALSVTINADKGITVSANTLRSDTVPNVGDAISYEPTPSSGTVASVVDGDTFTLTDGWRVRLIGINAPEVNQPFAENAKDELERLILDKTIELQTDVSSTDGFGRLLKYAFVDGIFVNKELVRLGLANATAYPPDTALQAELEAAEGEAQEEGRGMWAESETVYIIANVVFHYDAGGDDNQNLNDEYFVLRNDGEAAIDFTGWVARDAANHIFYFPELLLPQGSAVTIRTGYGTNSDSILYWGSEDAVWNNDHDTLYLSDELGHIVTSFTY